jgi:hypothetical protein
LIPIQGKYTPTVSAEKDAATVLWIGAKIKVAFRSAKAALLSRSERRLYDAY